MNRRAALLALLLAACGDGAATSRDAAPDAAPDARLRPDAALAPCGIEEPGSRCASASVLERCDGTRVTSGPCAAGTVCATDPATGRGAACIAPVGACGAIVELGSCSGPILTRCKDDLLQVIDCADRFATCFTDERGGLSQCRTPCTEVAVTAEGACTADGQLRRCVFDDGAFSVVTAPCPAGTTCQRSGPETSLPSCSPDPACGTIGVGGSCDGDLVLRCSGGQTLTTDCAAAGEVCAYGGASAGYACAPRSEVGERLVAGHVTYDDRVARVDTFDPPVARPVRGAAVMLVDDGSGRVLGSGATDESGGYQLRFDAPAGAPVHVLVVAAGASRARPVRVLRSDGLLHGYASPAFAAAAASAVDLHVTEASGGGAFNILDTLTGGLDEVRAIFATDAPPPVTAVWSKGGAVLTGTIGNLFRVRGTIDDDDSYDDAVLLHELAHTVENNFGRQDNPGGLHVYLKPTVPTQAWSEGFATYFGSVVRDDPVYLDSNLAGGFSFEIEHTVTPADPLQDQQQPIAEITVSQILWDLGDARPDDDDPAVGPHQVVLRVEDLYLRSSPVARGVAGADLVDFLDGYLLLNGAGRCAELRAVLASRSFPYDFAGPLGCPP